MSTRKLTRGDKHYYRPLGGFAPRLLWRSGNSGREYTRISSEKGDHCYLPWTMRRTFHDEMKKLGHISSSLVVSSKCTGSRFTFLHFHLPAANWPNICTLRPLQRTLSLWPCLVESRGIQTILYRALIITQPCPVPILVRLYFPVFSVHRNEIVRVASPRTHSLLRLLNCIPVDDSESVLLFARSLLI